MMYAESLKFPPPHGAEIRVKTADLSDIDDIARVSGLGHDHIVSLLKSGVTCFLAAKGDDRAASIGWAASGLCYIRGVGLAYDFGPDGSYGFWSVTSPEARGQGLHFALVVERADHEMKRGANKFYSLIEFDNKLSLDLRVRIGFEPLLDVLFCKICGVKFSYVRDRRTRKPSWKVFVREPRGDIIVI